jgi:hypothetical protein
MGPGYSRPVGSWTFLHISEHFFQRQGGQIGRERDFLQDFGGWRPVGLFLGRGDVQLLSKFVEVVAMG